jgi:hypothetical protein
MVIFFYFFVIFKVIVAFFFFNIIETYRCGDFVYYDNNNEQQLGRLRAILINEVDQQYRLKIQKVLYYDELPGNFKGELR